MVFSSSFFSIYIKGMLQKLRKGKLGCHIAGIWMAAAMYADDLFFMAPEDDGHLPPVWHNLMFSPSKSSCVIFCGKRRLNKKPDPVLLTGKSLQWTDQCEHLRHVLHESMSVDNDCNRARKSYNARAAEMRDQLCFCTSEPRINGIQLFRQPGGGVIL